MWPEANLALCLKKKKGQVSNILVADHMNPIKYSHESEFVCKLMYICRCVCICVNYAHICVSVYRYTLTCIYSYIQKYMPMERIH